MAWQAGFRRTMSDSAPHADWRSRKRATPSTIVCGLAHSTRPRWTFRFRGHELESSEARNKIRPGNSSGVARAQRNRGSAIFCPALIPQTAFGLSSRTAVAHAVHPEFRAPPICCSPFVG